MLSNLNWAWLGDTIGSWMVSMESIQGWMIFFKSMFYFFTGWRCGMRRMGFQVTPAVTNEKKSCEEGEEKKRRKQNDLGEASLVIVPHSVPVAGVVDIVSRSKRKKMSNRVNGDRQPPSFHPFSPGFAGFSRVFIGLRGLTNLTGVAWDAARGCRGPRSSTRCGQCRNKWRQNKMRRQ